MAINIQEILHPSDSNAIKFEKINYNFDQIVANGGGPTGQKGGLGQQGNPGPQGQKGEKGDVGAQGLTGATTSRWKVIPAPLNQSTKTYSILKPKLEGDTSHPTIFLGDQTFDETQNQDGYEFNSTLTLGKHAVGNSGSSELLTFWHGANDVDPTQLSGVVITSEDYTQIGSEYTGAGVQYKLAPSFNSGNALESQFMIDIDRFVIGDGTKVEFENITGGTSTFRAPKSNIAANEAGLIRFNGTSFQGSFEVTAAPGTYEWVDFCTAPCGQGGGYSISLEDGSDLSLDVNGYVTGNSVSFAPIADVELDNSGADWDPAQQGGSPTTTTTQAPATTTTQAPATTTTLAPTTTTTTTAPVYDVTITALDNIANAQIYNVASGGSPSNTITKTGLLSGASIGDAFYVEADTGYNISPSQVNVSSWGGGGNHYVDPNVNSAGRVVVGWNDVLDPNNLAFDIGIDGAVTQFTYTVSVVETDDLATICSETVSNNTFDYPQGEGGANFLNYFLNNYTVNGASGAIQILTSTEPSFGWGGWAIVMNDQNESAAGWFNCNSGGGNASVTITGQEWVYTLQGPEDYLATPSNIFAADGVSTPTSFQWALTGDDPSKFSLTNATNQTCTVDYIWTSPCGTPSNAILNCTVSGYDSNGQSIPSVSDTHAISGCDDSTGGSSGG